MNLVNYSLESNCTIYEQFVMKSRNGCGHSKMKNSRLSSLQVFTRLYSYNIIVISELRSTAAFVIRVRIYFIIIIILNAVGLQYQQQMYPVETIS